MHFVKQQNRPFNVQVVTDNLAQFGIKKGQVQRALESLAESGKLVCKVNSHSLCRSLKDSDARHSNTMDGAGVWKGENIFASARYCKSSSQGGDALADCPAPLLKWHARCCCHNTDQAPAGDVTPVVLQELEQQQQRAKDLAQEVTSTGDTIKQMQKGMPCKPELQAEQAFELSHLTMIQC